jgi:hypothetical protein
MQRKACVIWDFRHEVDGNCERLGYYTACSGNSLSTFRDILSVPPSRSLLMNYHYTLCNSPEERNFQEQGS